MEITFISDYVCPYCLVAKEALKQALEESGMDARITWQPYELTPEPKERVDTYHDETRKAHYQVLVEPAAQLGLDMKLPPNVVPRPYSRLAFEGWYYACEKGRGEAYNDLVYRAYFLEEQDIGEISVLAQLAQRAGLDPADFTAALEQGVYSQAEREAVAYARNVLKPTGVPTIYLNGEKIVLHDYTKAEMLRILNREAAADGGPSFSCSEGSCGLR